ncbi:DUF1149 family protein [Listeria ilorinensis]|uniref:DUF1149 family protein n=1 Tax=Listeria ilorinensis TaxID=2867439 RepID=UPI001EF40311|nr:DUF1149 family protein [Listeria ilorinensis]
MEVKVNQIIVEKFNFETHLEAPKEVQPTIRVDINEVEPTEENKTILEDGKIYKIEVPFELILPRFKIDGKISRLVQIVGFSGTATEIDKKVVQELSAPLISYIRRLTYEVTEIAFDEPGVDLNFEAN